MNKLVIIFISSFLALSSTSLVKPRDLLDDAKEQLEQLKSVVQGEIFVAHDDLDTLFTQFKSNQMSVSTNAGIVISKFYYHSIQQPLYNMVDLANSAGHDVTTCTDVREDTLESLPDYWRRQISSCIQPIEEEAVKAARDARYIVDIAMNKVHNLENQLNRCKEDLLCISPIFTEIELNKIRLPQNIKTEVQATDSVFTLMRISVKDCSDSNLNEYIAQANLLLKEIQSCIEEIMD